MNSDELVQALTSTDPAETLWVQVGPGDLRKVEKVAEGDDMDGWCTYIVLEPNEAKS